MDHPRKTGGLAALALALALPVAGWSQDAAPAPEDGQPRAAGTAASGAQPEGNGTGGNLATTGTAAKSASRECDNAAGKAVPATQPQPDDDGMSPANSGSTGWSGGTGGSQLGTNAQGGLPGSKTWHAPTARGLDLSGRPEPADLPQDGPKPEAADLAGLPDC